MTNNKQDSYRSIMKATSLFGGVQVYQILISLIKSKLVAVIIGPEGLGIMSLYQNGLSLIQSVSSMGLSTSAVRDVSKANNDGDSSRISYIVAVVRKLVRYTGLIGLLLVLFLSPILSKISFGNYDYAIPYALLSVTLLIDQLCVGQKVVLQGMRRLGYLAKSMAIGSTLGLIVSIPLYYFIGVKGIVPTLILNSVTAFVLSSFFASKLNIEKVTVGLALALKEGSQMMKMGLSMSLTNIVGYITAYAMSWFIRSIGGVEEVGLFQAGYAIMATYTGLIFNAMSTDYYPRLAAVNSDNYKCMDIINQQLLIAILLLAPLLAICALYSPLIVPILYSNDFLSITNYMVLASLGMMFKIVSWCIAFVFIAKSEAKLFVISELFISIFNLICNIVGYKLYGLTGLGLSFAFGYLIYMLQVYMIAHVKYRYIILKTCLGTYSILLCFIILTIAISFMLDGILKYILGTLVIILVSLYSYNKLNNLLNLKQYLVNRLKR